MELVIADAARVAGVSQRTAQRAMANGSLGLARVLGRQGTTDDLAVRSWVRTTSRGRKWTGKTLDAAIALLSGGDAGALSASERSRLRASLRTMTARHIASSAWVGTWARYRSLAEVDAQLIGPSLLDMTALGIVPGPAWVRFAQATDLDHFEAHQPVAADPDGDLVVIERPHDDRRARHLVDTYALGDERESAAAARELEAVAHAL